MFSHALLTDFYELTMAYGYWESGKESDEAAFHLFFRENPFDGGFAIAAGLQSVIEYLDALRFAADDLQYLGEFFPPRFIEHLRGFRFTCDVDAVPEGTVVFPHEPLLRVTGPIAQAQIVESALLNFINFQTLIATKASRIVLAAKGDPVIDFGLRRAQGVDGALSATRAAFIGGVSSTSNVLAGARFGIPVKGTHAHSWVMSFPSELEAFDAYARVMPDNALLLVDTYNTLDGVRNAIEIGRRLRAGGHDLLGIRLDSGDLAYLSIEARKLLDAAGFYKTAIAASNELDEYLITSLKDQGAMIDLWGVGTRLVTAFDQPALGGVYKLSAIRREGGAWEHRVKLSEQSIKISNPGVLNVRRFEENGRVLGDMIWDEAGAPPTNIIVDPFDLTRRKSFGGNATGTDLLVPVYRRGVRVYESPSLPAIAARATDQLKKFHAGLKRFMNPHRFPVGLEQQLFDLKTRLVLEARGVRT
jgi:nicotinate phosphoribosyltransferase